MEKLLIWYISKLFRTIIFKNKYSAVVVTFGYMDFEWSEYNGPLPVSKICSNYLIINS